jgi:hypothetical protein
LKVDFSFFWAYELGRFQIRKNPKWVLRAVFFLGRSALYMSQNGFRVNIESHLFGDIRFRNLQKMLRSIGPSLDQADLYEMAAIGMLVRLWRESQAEFVSVATSDQIDCWTTEQAHMLLLRAGFLRLEGGFYEIVGNSAQLEAIKIWFDNKSRAGKRSAEVRAEKRLKNEHSDKNLNDFSTGVQQVFNRRSTGGQQNPTQLQVQDQIQVQIEEKEKSKKEKSASTTPTPSGAGDLVPFKNPPKKKCYKFEQSDLTLALDWIAETHKLHPHIKLKSDVCADAIRKTREHTGRTDEQMSNIAQWIWKDDFWSKNCLSPAALLGTSKNGLKKIDNILASISKDKRVVNQQQLEDWYAGDEEPF